jgi:hypothetical protein
VCENTSDRTYTEDLVDRIAGMIDIRIRRVFARKATIGIIIGLALQSTIAININLGSCIWRFGLAKLVGSGTSIRLFLRLWLGTSESRKLEGSRLSRSLDLITIIQIIYLVAQACFQNHDSRVILSHVM